VVKLVVADASAPSAVRVGDRDDQPAPLGQQRPPAGHGPRQADQRVGLRHQDHVEPLANARQVGVGGDHACGTQPRQKLDAPLGGLAYLEHAAAREQGLKVCVKRGTTTDYVFCHVSRWTISMEGSIDINSSSSRLASGRQAYYKSAFPGTKSWRKRAFIQ